MASGQASGLPPDIDVLVRALETAVFGVGITDLQGTVTYVNDAVRRMWRFDSKDEIIGRPLLDFWHGDGVKQTLAALAAGGGRTGEDVGLRKDGTTFPVQFSANVVFGGDGRPLCTIGCFVDVSELKQVAAEREAMERKLWETQKLESLGLLAGGVAHDFSNLLVAILGSADLALADLPLESPARAHIEHIMAGARQAGELARQMLAYSGRGKLVVQTVDLSRLVNEMSHLLRASVGHLVTLRLRLSGDPVPVSGDVTQLRQVILNLITNASEAIGDAAGNITVSTGVQQCDRAYLDQAILGNQAPPGAYAYLEVSDSGCGMDAATVERMFDPFFTSKKSGRGLGLASVQGIVRGHQGVIRIYTEPGHGTAVKVLLPAVAAPLQEVSSGRQFDDLQIDGEKTVLLVDDEDYVRRVARRMLQRFGFTVLEAENGSEALALYKANRERICCVLLDMTMPEMSGEACFRELRRLDKELPIVVSSGYSTEEVSESFNGRNNVAFLQKPYDRKLLLQALREVLGA